MLLNVYLLLQEFKLILFSVPQTPNLHQQDSFNVYMDIFTRFKKGNTCKNGIICFQPKNTTNMKS